MNMALHDPVDTLLPIATLFPPLTPATCPLGEDPGCGLGGYSDAGVRAWACILGCVHCLLAVYGSFLPSLPAFGPQCLLFSADKALDSQLL